MESLAPVGSTESLKAAVYGGADAVYLGMQNFNARRQADNFNASSLKEAILLKVLCVRMNPMARLLI